MTESSVLQEIIDSLSAEVETGLASRVVVVTHEDSQFGADLRQNQSLNGIPVSVIHFATDQEMLQSEDCNVITSADVIVLCRVSGPVFLQVLDVAAAFSSIHVETPIGSHGDSLDVDLYATIHGRNLIVKFWS